MNQMIKHFDKYCIEECSKRQKSVRQNFDEMQVKFIKNFPFCPIQYMSV